MKVMFQTARHHAAAELRGTGPNRSRELHGKGSGLFLALMADGDSKAPSFLPDSAGRAFHRS
jgi:hypothetical protein